MTSNFQKILSARSRLGGARSNARPASLISPAEMQLAGAVLAKYAQMLRDEGMPVDAQIDALSAKLARAAAPAARS